MPKRLPLPTLLSYALVSYTIEFDNEAERRMTHYTTRDGKRGTMRPWLVSLAMYSNCMRLVDEKGIPAAELVRRACAKPNFSGMSRWGYITVDPSTKRVRATPAGMAARAIWEPLFATIEERWTRRFGDKLLGELRTLLGESVAHIEIELPEALPILGFGLVNHVGSLQRSTATAAEIEGMTLSALLAKPLLAFALAYERDSDLSLAIGANVLRLFSGVSVRARDLPQLGGVSKEAIAMALGYLSKRGFATIEKEGGARIVRLTPKGRDARRAYELRLAAVEKHWRERFGKDSVDRLQSLLGGMTIENGELSPRLLEGLTPHPENWRAALARPTVLPHFPMVLHRGGYPDGS